MNQEAWRRLRWRLMMKEFGFHFIFIWSDIHPLSSEHERCVMMGKLPLGMMKLQLTSCFLLKHCHKKPDASLTWQLSLKTAQGKKPNNTSWNDNGIKCEKTHFRWFNIDNYHLSLLPLLLYALLILDICRSLCDDFCHFRVKMGEMVNQAKKEKEARK